MTFHALKEISLRKYIKKYLILEVISCPSMCTYFAYKDIEDVCALICPPTICHARFSVLCF